MAASTTKIKELVRLDLPDTTNPTDAIIDGLAKVFQLYLAPRLNKTGDDIEDDTKWSTLENNLIAKLIVRERALNALKVSTASAGGGTGSGGIKSIKTGPSEASWHDVSTYWKSVLGNTTNSFAEFEKEVCMWARDLGVRLPFCEIPLDTKIFIVAKKRKSCR